MSKLTLRIDELAVQTFATEDEEAARRGTVRGMDSGPSCDMDTCNGATSCGDCTDFDSCVTCTVSCLGSCASCPVSCNPADCPSADGRC